MEYYGVDDDENEISLIKQTLADLICHLKP